MIKRVKQRRQKRRSLALPMTLVLVGALLWPLSVVPGSGAIPASAAPIQEVAIASALPAALPVAAPVVAAPTVAETVTAQAAMTTTITLSVVNARSEPRAFGGQGVTATEPITAPYQFLISVDNTGDPFDTSHCFAYTDPPTNTDPQPSLPRRAATGLACAPFPAGRRSTPRATRTT